MTGSLSAVHHPLPLHGVRVVELSADLACAAAGRLFADLGASVTKYVGTGLDLYAGDGLGLDDVPAEAQQLLFRYLNHDKRLVDRNRKSWAVEAAGADVVLTDVPHALDELVDLVSRTGGPTAPVAVNITPWGETGPAAGCPGNDFTACHASGFGFDLRAGRGDPPLVGPSRSAAFLVGVTACAAALHGLLLPRRQTVRRIDVSMQEAISAAHQPRYNTGSGPLPTSAATSGNPVVFSLPCADGAVAVSPREPHQWAAWVGVMGSPTWALDPRFDTMAGRRVAWPVLYPAMATWSHGVGAHDLFERARAARVPCLVHSTPPGLLASEQLRERRFFVNVGGSRVVPGSPFELTSTPAPAAVVADRQTSEDELFPLEGMRVLDFSWVLAGPICTRYLGMLGAEVLKVESRSRPALSVRNAEWVRTNTGKRSLTLDLRTPAAREIVRELATHSDVVVENFSTGVMERLAIGRADLERIAPSLVFASSSSFGRTGPDRNLGAYGTLIQCFTGWAAQCAPPGGQVLTTGGIWTDPYVGMLQTACILAAIHRSRTGTGTYIDLSMAEATIATLPDPLMQWQSSGELPEPLGNRDRVRAPQGVYAAEGEDSWVAISVENDEQWARLVTAMDRPDLNSLACYRQRAAAHDEIDEAVAAWTRDLSGADVVDRLRAAGVPVTACRNAATVREDEQLVARGFLGPIEGEIEHGSRLPWFVDGSSIADRLTYPELGEANRDIVRGVLGRSQADFESLNDDGVLF
jgi:crotonobetainyl-CoA:carnitine CoA-transferase CaiB-like acyl-CoA transferase